jgi:hypothetical protein
VQVRRLLDLVEDQIKDPSTQRSSLTRFDLLDILGSEVEELTSEFQFDWAAKRLAPAIRTSTGERSYALPDNFGQQFARGSGTFHFALNMSDGSNEAPLTFEDSATFFVRNLEGEANGRPSVYTIHNKHLYLSVPPDSNSSSHYTLNGLYVPTDFLFEEIDEVLPLDSPVLRHRLVARVLKTPEMGQRAARATAQLNVNTMRARQPNLKPRLSANGVGRSSSRMRRRI